MFLIGGENLVDFIQVPDDGGYPCYRAVPGGGPYNVAKTMARQEIATGYLTPFSTDTLGQLLAQELNRETALTRLGKASPRPTSLAVVSLDKGQATYQFYREGTAERDVTAAELLAAVPEGATGVFAGTLALADGADAAAWEELITTLRGRGLFVALDPNVRPAFIHDRESYLARLSRLLNIADLVKLSDEDIAWIYPDHDRHDAARELASTSTAGLFVLTRGAEGAFGIANGTEIEVPVHPVPQLVDTIGAGDTFMGTLIAECVRRGRTGAGSMSDLTPDEATAILRAAAKAAAINCGRQGCNPPTPADLEG